MPVFSAAIQQNILNLQKDYAGDSRRKFFLYVNMNLNFWCPHQQKSKISAQIFGKEGSLIFEGGGSKFFLGGGHKNFSPGGGTPPGKKFAPPMYNKKTVPSPPQKKY